jgi:hypothetical protein
MFSQLSFERRRLRWRDLYREAELYKAVVRVYTKPLFQWRKALASSTDERTLYDLAARGLRGLDDIHRRLAAERFEFRPALALLYNFNGRERTIYVSPWEERIVDLLLYRVLNRRWHATFSRDSYAYRDRSYGLDQCQARIAEALRAVGAPAYVVKRDIAEYFASVDHEILLRKLAERIEPEDYLFRLVVQRVRFRYQHEQVECVAEVGIPFGSAMACLFANLYLDDLDRAVRRTGVAYFRYADDLLGISKDAGTAREVAATIDRELAALYLRDKPSHRAELVLASAADRGFLAARDFRHLGLQFSAGGYVRLSRDKCRKIQNLFRYAFRRSRPRWRKIAAAHERAQAIINVARETLERGVRNVAIVDYYLKHTDDEAQLRGLDRWLAEEVLSAVFGGHKKGNFARLGFDSLRAMGLPSLVHRRRLILHQQIESPFFIWQRQKFARASKGTVARLRRAASAGSAFSPAPEAAAKACP